MPDISPGGSSIEERLDRLESIEAARAVLASYAQACDAQDLAALGHLFASDSELEIPGRTWQGIDEVVDFFRQAWKSDPSQKSHFITNVTTSCPSPGVVAIESYFIYTAAGDATSVLGWGEYRDVVDTSGPYPVFARKAISIRRAVDVRGGWSLEPSGSDGHHS